MPNTFSIENINLNGHILTAQDGRLYIDNEQVKNTSGIQLTERFFIKGYAPVSFYSRWSTIGNYLNETYFNDRFMATGILISCAIPATGSVTLAGRFYARNPNSVIDTETIGYFNLPTKQTFIREPINYKIDANKIIGLDIYQAPNELKSISCNLLGYSPAAGHFDKMPASINLYIKDQIYTGLDLEEKYNQYSAQYTGIKILSKTPGFKTVNREYITGYVSGYLYNNPKYILSSGETNLSGYIIDGNKYFFGTGSSFNQFNNIPQFFNSVSGFLWQGFQLSGDQSHFYSGYENEKYGLGEIFESIGQRTIPVPEFITGFISGYKPSGGSFIPLNQISGFSGDERIGNLPLTSGTSGYLIGSSGLYIGLDKNFFKTGNEFSGFLEFPSVFTEELGYQYYPIATNPDYLYTNYFTGIHLDSSGGYTGELIGYIGYRYQPSGQPITGFVKVKSEYNFDVVSVFENGISGLSGYYIGNNIFKFRSGNQFSGFDDQNNFYPDPGYKFEGFDLNNLFSFSDAIGTSVILQKTITGFMSGELDSFNNFIKFTGINASSGYIIDGTKYYFTGTFSGITSGMFGFTDNLGFQYIVDQNTFQYDNSNFIGNNGNITGSGIITGNIGYKNIIGTDYTFGSGSMKSIIGYRDLYDTSPLLGKFYYKNDNNEKIFGPEFTLNTGNITNKINLSNNVFIVPEDKFLGIDIYKTLSGLNGFNIALFGFYE